jgi:transcriptional regulator GlxA family with amidase domain
LEKALEMMDEGNMTKTAIARACGYYDLSHLEQALKRNARTADTKH